jgi:thioredoxin-dependent peroxiredoxin
MRRSFGRGLAAIGLGAALVGGLAVAADEGPKVGDKAPDFELKGTDGKTYRLADFKGKQAVVLAWFPKADTPGCTKECKSFKAGGDALRALNVAYFTISVDPVEANKQFSDKYGFDYPILSDPDKTTAKAYGVLNPQRGVAQRWTFYIDKRGVIREIDKAIKTDRAAVDVADKIKELGIADKG